MISLLFVVAMMAMFAVFSGILADHKHRNPVGWVLLGFIFGPFGLIVALLPPVVDTAQQAAQKAQTRTCPECREPIRYDARVCKHCGLRYRATLPGRDSVLKGISIYYAPHNQRARITEVYLGDAPTLSVPAAGGTATVAVPSAASARAHASTLKLRWKVENPDNDELIYKLWFRQEGDSVWRALGGPDPLGKPEYDWSTDSVPDGRYATRN